jgi:glycosyltransferase involved in cell wall biosynthesis
VTALRILLIAFYFPPAGGGGVQRPLKFASHLSRLGVEVHVLCPTDPRWIHRDDGLVVPADVHVHRVPYWGPRGRLPAAELFGRTGLARVVTKARLTPRRLLVPDENATFALTAVPAAVRLVRRVRPTILMTTSPPTSIHLVGAATKRLTGVRWVADVRDSIVANHDREVERPLVRLREATHGRVARIVARRADAIVAVTPTIAREFAGLGARGRIEVIGNGVDFDDVAELSYTPGKRFRITHTGSFFGGRLAQPFLEALAASDLDIVARFVGDFRPSEREWALAHGLRDRIEVVPHATHRESLALQSESDALLLLLPDRGPRGLDVPSGKLFEYLASGRPILAAVPSEGAAAQLIRGADAGIVVAPDDPDAIREGLARLHRRWTLDPTRTRTLPPDMRRAIDRAERAVELKAFLERLA